MMMMLMCDEGNFLPPPSTRILSPRPLQLLPKRNEEEERVPVPGGSFCEKRLFLFIMMDQPFAARPQEGVHPPLLSPCSLLLVAENRQHSWLHVVV